MPTVCEQWHNLLRQYEGPKRMSKFRWALLASAFLAAVGAAPAAQATTGWGCFRVINVRTSDTLNLRAKPASKSEIVERLVPAALMFVAPKCWVIPQRNLHGRW